MKDYLIKEDVFMALTGDITDCTIEEFIARLRDKLSKLPTTSLPKGHKRLIEDNFDVGPVLDKEGYITSYKYVTKEDLDNAPTIIPADNAESEG
jgi:hypothetical protein